MNRGEFEIETLRFDETVLDEIALPGGVLCLTQGFGSGLARRASDGPGLFWAVGDRGPNLKVRVAVERYGLDGLKSLVGVDGAKIMPALEHGPAIAQFRIEGDRISLVRILPLRGQDGRPLSGLPPPEIRHAEREPIYSLEGEPLGTDAGGVDSEGIVALADGGFWIGDEYGPSLLKVDGDGRVVVRWVPEGAAHMFEGAPYPVEGRLPAIAAARRLNRGFEALALSADESELILAFQSPLSHPDRAAHEQSRIVRIWRLDAVTGELLAEYAYRLEPPTAFRRDLALGDVEQSDIKVSEAAMLGEDRLLILERGSASTKFFAVELRPEYALSAAFADPATRPTLEQLDEAALAEAGVTPLTKTLVLDTDEAPEIPGDLEGAILLAPRELLLVNDNDFGVERVRTEYRLVKLDQSIGT